MFACQLLDNVAPTTSSTFGCLWDPWSLLERERESISFAGRTFCDCEADSAAVKSLERSLYASWLCLSRLPALCAGDVAVHLGMSGAQLSVGCVGITYKAPTKACHGETEADGKRCNELHCGTKVFSVQTCTFPMEMLPSSQVWILYCNPISALSAGHLEGAKTLATCSCT